MHPILYIFKISFRLLLRANAGQETLLLVPQVKFRYNNGYLAHMCGTLVPVCWSILNGHASCILLGASPSNTSLESTVSQLQGARNRASQRCQAPEISAGKVKVQSWLLNTYVWYPGTCSLVHFERPRRPYPTRRIAVQYIVGKPCFSATRASLRCQALEISAGEVASCTMLHFQC